MLRGWILSLTAAALLTAGAEALLPPSGGVRRAGRLICGLIVILMLLQPVTGLQRVDWSARAPTVCHSPSRSVTTLFSSQSMNPSGLTCSSISHARNSVRANARQGRPRKPMPGSHSPVSLQR